MTRTRDIELKF